MQRRRDGSGLASAFHPESFAFPLEEAFLEQDSFSVFLGRSLHKN